MALYRKNIACSSLLPTLSLLATPQSEVIAILFLCLTTFLIFPHSGHSGDSQFSNLRQERFSHSLFIPLLHWTSVDHTFLEILGKDPKFKCPKKPSGPYQWIKKAVLRHGHVGVWKACLHSRKAAPELLWGMQVLHSQIFHASREAGNAKFK